jgi:hypothetical protein
MSANDTAATARIPRNIAALILVIGLVLGTVLWQTDDTWPFAQMRMFPGGGESEISFVSIQATFEDGRRARLSAAEFHLRRAEIEGQMRVTRADPSRLGILIDRYNSTHDRKITKLRLLKREARRGDARADDWIETELAAWPR